MSITARAAAYYRSYNPKWYAGLRQRELEEFWSLVWELRYGND